MFLELSFDSRAGDKEVATSKAASSWRYDLEDKEEQSLDDLISDLRTSTASRKSASVSSSRSSPLRMASPPKQLKSRDGGMNTTGFRGRTRPVDQGSKEKKKVVRTARNVRDVDLSDEESATVMPTPRLDRILKQRPSIGTKRRVPTAKAPRSKITSPQPRKQKPRSPVMSSRLLSPPSLSQVTSPSDMSSPLSVSEDIYMPLTPDEDSIDALIGKDIRDLNKLISAGSQRAGLPGAKKVGAARSPTTDEIGNVLRKSTRFRKEVPKHSSQGGSHSKSKDVSSSRSSSLRLSVPVRKPKFAMLESPPPPPPPDDDEDEDEDDEEDSFAEEIRKLRESRRLANIPTKAAVKTPPKEDTTTESSEICATAALKVRNASNVINGLLLEALKPFEDRQIEEEKAKTLEDEKAGGDAAIRNAASAELQSATQTIVSQLDLTFAEMTERRNGDLKAEADAAAAAKATEKKEKEDAEEKMKAEQKEAKERENEILRLIPMQGKLLTCSADIENVLVQLESADSTSQTRSIETTSVVEAEIETLHHRTQRRIQEIEARMKAAPTAIKPSDRGISWRTVDWVRDNFEVDNLVCADKDANPLQDTGNTVNTSDASTDEPGPFNEVIQRQVMEKLDLTILKLKHVLAIDTKEAAEAQDIQQREKAEEKKQQVQKKLEDERKQRELEDADNAKRRVMGLTSVDEVEGWVEEGRQLQNEFTRESSLDQLMVSLDNHMGSENVESPRIWMHEALSNQAEAMLQFDRLTRAMKPAEMEGEEKFMSRGRDERHAFNDMRSHRHRKQPSGVRRQIKSRWIESSSSASESEDDSTSSADDGNDVMPPVLVTRRRSKHDQQRVKRATARSPPLSPVLSPPPRVHQHSSAVGTWNSSKIRRERAGYSDSEKQFDCENVHPVYESKKRRQKVKSSRLQHEMALTIQALQIERRQKAAWIKNDLRYCKDVVY